MDIPQINQFYIGKYGAKYILVMQLEEHKSNKYVKIHYRIMDGTGKVRSVFLQDFWMLYHTQNIAPETS
jgi:hypothetical protein